MHAGRADCVGHKACGIVRPFDDIDLFATEFPDDCLHARALHADAGSHGVYLSFTRRDGDLGAIARLTDCTTDDDRAVVDFWDLLLEEFD